MKAIVFFVLMSFAVSGIGCAGGRGKTSVKTAPVDMRVRAVSAYSEEDYSRAIMEYSALIKDYGPSPEYLNNRGAAYLQTGQLEFARRDFESASILQPQNQELLVNVGIVYTRKGDYEKAGRFFDQALDLAPGYPKALYGKGILFLNQNKPEQALSFFTQAFAQGSADKEIIFAKALAEQRSKLYSEAIASYTYFIERETEEKVLATAYANRSICYFSTNKDEQAQKDLDKALELDDSQAIYHFNRGVAKQKKQEFAAAVKDFTRAIVRDQNMPEAYTNRGTLRYITGEETDGCSDLQRACELGLCRQWEAYVEAKKCEE